MEDNLVIPFKNVGQVSDGCHTFDELYDHRCMLWLHVLAANKDKAFKTLRDLDNNEMAGWFIAGMNTVYGQLSYHLPLRLWNSANITEIPCNSGYDGHCSQDVLYRLRQLLG